jgi:type I restriction enzyme, S subunit
VKVSWKTAPLGEVCSMIKRGVAPKYVEADGVLVLNQKCIRDHKINYTLARQTDSSVKPVPTERYIRLGDVLVNSTGVGTLGRVAQVRSVPIEDTTVDTHVTILRPIAGLFDLDFFGYMLIVIEHELANSGQGASGQTELSRKDLVENFYVSYPDSIDEQKRIVSILNQAFEGLDQAHANAEANLESARELFERVLDIAFSIKGQLNRVPDWEYKKLSDVAVISPSKKLAKSKLHDNEFVSFVPMDHLGILQTSFSPKEDRLLSEVYSGYTYFEDGDVLIAKITPCFENGKMGIVEGMTNGVGFGSSEFVPLRSSGSIIPKFLFYYLRRDKFRRQGAKLMTGAVGHKRVPKDYIENLNVPVPTLDEQQRIISQLDAASRSIDAMCAKYTSKLSDLGDLRQSLLEKAFAGELT